MMVVKNVKAADQVWIAVALLQKEQPGRGDFSIEEIKGKLLQEFGLVYAPATILTHISKQCVASEIPNPGRYRMLTRTSRGRYRLFRPGDYYHPEREHGKTMPSAREIPAEYLVLLDSFETEYGPEVKLLGPDSLLLRMEAGASGQKDVSSAHDRYLVEAYREGHSDPASHHPA
ncbi:MAG: hypothetical protein Q7K03_03105 [Dehalococcoidia bacterium]|nr:hypothetical protein [Dehalococcoidia bacterium]